MYWKTVLENAGAELWNKAHGIHHHGELVAYYEVSPSLQKVLFLKKMSLIMKADVRTGTLMTERVAYELRQEIIKLQDV